MKIMFECVNKIRLWDIQEGMPTKNLPHSLSGKQHWDIRELILKNKMIEISPRV